MSKTTTKIQTSQAIENNKPFFEGFLLIDKPAGMTSHDVVDRVRRLTGEQRVGHAGTLDPFATGLLIVGVGRVATREMQKLVGLDKTYEATFVLGASSTTDDTEGEITPAPLTTPLTVAPGFSLGAIQVQPEPRLKPGATASAIQVQPDRRLPPSLKLRGAGKPAATAIAAIEEATKQFIGEIEQVPPTYSAIKVGGKKMYEAAREGKPIEGKPRRVIVRAFDISPIGPIGLIGPITRIRAHIRCSSGTYIRSLARDLGRALGGGGYVEQLRRTSIGPFLVKEAVTLDELGSRGLQPAPDRRLKPAATIPVPQFLAKL